MSERAKENGKKIKINTFWSKFNKFLGAEIPSVILNILISAGYDNALSISDLNEDDIQILEQHATENSNIIGESNLYSTDGPFRFLPGHKKTLYTLRRKAEDFLKQSKGQTRKYRFEPVGQGEQSEQIELLTEEEIKVLKKTLLDKVNSTPIALGLDTRYTEDNLLTTIDAYISHNSRKSRKSENKASYRCTVKCCLCTKPIPCTFNSRWETGNLDCHLKSHSNKKSKSSSPSTSNGNKTSKHQTSKTASPKSKPVIISINQQNVSELNEILEH